MNIQSIVENELVQDGSSVWVLKGHERFGYSDGGKSERYLEKVFRSAGDLSTQSSELEAYITDWPSEYHLSVKRAQLLAGFTFDRAAKVLEVGCGCGAITRFLGETFDDVVSVEGSLNRARLARLRVKDIDGVSIICAPFQEIKFARKFDIIFCVGVYEYSASFVGGETPYDDVLRYFRDILTPEGVVVIAIENQFGLKYFSSSREDHVGLMFEGVHGYHRQAGRMRTFGKAELERKLAKYFSAVQFYYPYPDYKLPDCVIAEGFLADGRAGELVSQMKSRDYAGELQPLLDETTVSLELARNNMLPFFANSFIAVAGRTAISSVRFEQMAVLFSSQRVKRFRTRTTISRRSDGLVTAAKRTTVGERVIEHASLKLVEGESAWIESYSLFTLVSLRCRSASYGLSEMFSPCKGWVELLNALSTSYNGVRYVSGDHIDTIWTNVYPTKDRFEIVDKEWIWHQNIGVNVIVVRAVYDFLTRVEDARWLSKKLQLRSGKRLIRSIAHAIGVELTEKDFTDFVELQSEVASLVYGADRTLSKAQIRWFLADRPTLRLSRRQSRTLSAVISRIKVRLSGYGMNSRRLQSWGQQ